MMTLRGLASSMIGYPHNFTVAHSRCMRPNLELSQGPPIVLSSFLHSIQRPLPAGRWWNLLFAVDLSIHVHKLVISEVGEILES
jgi:hypothetical protein